MRFTRWIPVLTCALLLGLAASAMAQDAPAPAAPVTIELAQVDPDAANRATVRQLLQHDAVVSAARVAHIDLAQIETGLTSLTGAELARAAQQAAAIDNQLNKDEVFTVRTTTIIIGLLVLLLLIIVL
ncbi:MAG: hypothetical protein ABR559_02055 [Gemmatimonadota bacterium]